MPASFSLLMLGVLFAAAMLVPDRALQQAATAAQSTAVGVAPARSQQPISLRDRLVVGLQARLKSEIEFVELVALRVQTGKLPQRLVDETFFWARERATNPSNGRKRRPIIYFQPAMKLRAARLDVPL